MEATAFSGPALMGRCTSESRAMEELSTLVRDMILAFFFWPCSSISRTSAVSPDWETAMRAVSSRMKFSK